MQWGARAVAGVCMASLMACAAEPTATEVAQAEMSLEVAEAADCRAEAVQPGVGVALAGVGESVQLDVSATDVVDVLLQNNGSENGVVTVTATVASEAGRDVREIDTVEVAPGATPYGIDVSDLQLPETSLAFSGIITIAAKIVYPNGTYDEDSSLRLSFHPTASGWAIYDNVTRDASFDGGALSAEARELRRAALRAAGDGEEVIVASSRGEKVSDSTDWFPASEDQPE